MRDNQAAPIASNVKLSYLPEVKLLLAVSCFLTCFLCSILADSGDSNPVFARRAEKFYLASRAQFHQQSTNSEAAVQFARACFDWAEFAKDDDQRESIANEGIAVCRQLVAREPDLAPAHYYLGMNLAQLARTKSLGALKIVGEMERVFSKVLVLDKTYDFAGADRNLGLLYLEVPSFSIGDKKKARKHLQDAVQLAADYPENHLLLLDAYLRWGEKNWALAEVEALNKLWPKAKEKFSGEAWEASWADWEQRFQKMKSRLGIKST
jgi:tetratricopeptide (TPR) repeat protein